MNMEHDKKARKIEKVIKIIIMVIIGLFIAAAIGLVLGLAVMWLWNALMPDIFGLPEIGYWQAVGLFLLCHLLFKGHGHGSDDSCCEDSGKHSSHGHVFHHGHHDHPFKKKIESWLNDEHRSCCQPTPTADEQTPQATPSDDQTLNPSDKAVASTETSKE